MDIKNSSPNSHNSDSDQIGCGNYPHHFRPYKDPNELAIVVWKDSTHVVPKDEGPSETFKWEKTM
jgi:hypothetical protein